MRIRRSSDILVKFVLRINPRWTPELPRSATRVLSCIVSTSLLVVFDRRRIFAKEMTILFPLTSRRAAWGIKSWKIDRFYFLALDLHHWFADPIKGFAGTDYTHIHTYTRRNSGNVLITVPILDYQLLSSIASKFSWVSLFQIETTTIDTWITHVQLISGASLI